MELLTNPSLNTEYKFIQDFRHICELYPTAKKIVFNDITDTLYLYYEYLEYNKIKENNKYPKTWTCKNKEVFFVILKLWPEPEGGC